MKQLLTIELVPSTCWFSNLRSELTPAQWDIVRRDCYVKAHYKCEICGGKGKKWPVECHEIWAYDDVRFIQKLVRTIALCPACHEVKHIGFAESRGHGVRARKHLGTVNGWNSVMVESYIHVAYAQWHKRSEHEWSLDLRWLTKHYDFNLDVEEPGNEGLLR